MVTPTGTVRLDIPCPGCGKKNAFELRRADLDPHFVCSGCGNLVKVNAAKFRKDVERALKDGQARIAATLRRLNKR